MQGKLKINTYEGGGLGWFIRGAKRVTVTMETLKEWNHRRLWINSADVKQGISIWTGMACSSMQHHMGFYKEWHGSAYDILLGMTWDSVLYGMELHTIRD